jgi:peptidoglycan/xylan/chitin deacetylase (PgdA/CDA1 family)
MSEAKKLLKGILNSFGKIIPLNTLIALSKQQNIVPVYHLVSDEKVPHIQHLYQVKSSKKFIQDLDFLLKHFEPTDYTSFQNQILSGEKSNKKAFLLTFDDGLSEFHDVIAPILVQKGIPAVCFLNSAFIDNKNLFFRYKVSLLIDKLKQNPSLLNEQVKFFPQNQNFESYLKRLRYSDISEIDSIAETLEVNFESYLTENKPYLTSEQIQNLIQKGFHFGSHSIDHPEYRFISLEEQVKQTLESTQVVTEKFNLDYKTFAFPFTDFGVSKEYFQQVNVLPKQVDLTFGCAGLKNDSYSNHIQRIPLEDKDKSAKEILRTEYVYYLLKAMLNKNKIVRK